MAKQEMYALARVLGYDTSFLTSKLSSKCWSCDNSRVKYLYKVSQDDSASILKGMSSLLKLNLKKEQGTELIQDGLDARVLFPIQSAFPSFIAKDSMAIFNISWQKLICIL